MKKNVFPLPRVPGCATKRELSPCLAPRTGAQESWGICLKGGVVGRENANYYSPFEGCPSPFRPSKVPAPPSKGSLFLHAAEHVGAARGFAPLPAPNEPAGCRYAWELSPVLVTCGPAGLYPMRMSAGLAPAENQSVVDPPSTGANTPCGGTQQRGAASFFLRGLVTQHRQNCRNGILLHSPYTCRMTRN